jgi:hypothetical protein
VHGHWVLQVKNADGSLGERREFDNALVTDDTYVFGDQIMAGLLSGNLSAGDPSIALIQPPVTGTPSSYCGGLANNTAANNTCFGLTTSASGLIGTGPANTVPNFAKCIPFKRYTSAVTAPLFTSSGGMTLLEFIGVLPKMLYFYNNSGSTVTPVFSPAVRC